VHAPNVSCVRVCVKCDHTRVLARCLRATHTHIPVITFAIIATDDNNRWEWGGEGAKRSAYARCSGGGVALKPSSGGDGGGGGAATLGQEQRRVTGWSSAYELLAQCIRADCNAAVRGACQVIILECSNRV
jgi:hypothetical protein